ncbi:MAG TPA: hypothetical protein PLK55_03950 [archaeon]|jgi:hypothetical protein|nr:hypothetical protein [archaeon]
MFDIKKVFILFSLVLILGTISAEGYMIDELFNNPEFAKEQYNANLDKMPGALRKFTGNEKIQLNVDYGTEIKSITLVMKDGAMDSYSTDGTVEPTLIVDTYPQTIDNLIKSNTPVNDFKTAVKEKTLKYRSVGFFKKIKFGFARFALNFFKQ